MKLYNCETELELKLKSTDLTKLTIDQMKSLALEIQTGFMNGYLQNDIIVSDVFVQIIKEIASRCE